MIKALNATIKNAADLLLTTTAECVEVAKRQLLDIEQHNELFVSAIALRAAHIIDECEIEAEAVTRILLRRPQCWRSVESLCGGDIQKIAACAKHGVYVINDGFYNTRPLDLLLILAASQTEQEHYAKRVLEAEEYKAFIEKYEVKKGQPARPKATIGVRLT